MGEALDPQTFTGAHPGSAEFVEQLLAWGYTRRGHDGPHVVYRAPGGGRVKVLQSMAGRVDAAQVAKAARYLNIDVEQFWAGPVAAVPTDEPAEEPAAAPVSTPPARTSRRRPADCHDSGPATVLAIHTRFDRPLSFDDVIEAAGGRITREQVRSASATLCRTGALDRIHRGVYQWAAGRRARLHYGPQQQPAAVVELVAPPTQPPPPSNPDSSATAALFARLFPDGITMTAETFADFEQLAAIAAKLGRAS